MRKLINCFLSGLSGVVFVYLLFNMFEYPVSIGRGFFYFSLLLPLILITVDLGFNEALSGRLDRVLKGRGLLVVHALIIIFVLAASSLWFKMYANQLLSGNTGGIGILYSVDTYSIYSASIPITLYIIYYYADLLYKYIASKNRL